MIAILGMLAAGCATSTGTAQPTDTASGADVIPTSAPSQGSASSAIDLTSAPAVAFTGNTDKKTRAFTIGSPVRVEYTFAGSGNFIVNLNYTDGSSIASVANRIGKGTATTWIYAANGQGYFDVTADGKWTLKATAALPKVSALPVTLKGTTDQVTAPFTATGDLTVA
jgi:hypothetical protein